jgi:dolichol-phosphate mannosyltransferase
LKTLIIIPTYCERENIVELCKLILDLSLNIDILVIDDNSPDGTASVVEVLSKKFSQIKLIKRPAKLGLGSAYIEGFKYALKNNYDYVFEMDADFSHNPDYIPEFLKKIENCDVIIGSRYIKGVSVVHWPMTRLFLSYLANLYTRVLTGLKIHDCTSGFKCFRRGVLQSLDLDEITSNGYAFQIEVNFLAKRKGFEIREIPIIFVERNAGVSKMNKKIVFEAVYIVLRLFFKRFLKMRDVKK